VLKNVCEAVIEIEDRRRVLVEKCYIVLSGGCLCTVDSGEFVLRDVGICIRDISVSSLT
jgi:hypothetical protein